MTTNSKRLRKGGDRFPLVPRAGMYLDSSCNGDGARFARLFRATWARLPRADKKRLMWHWRVNGGSIKLLSNWTSQDTSDSSGVLGQCGQGGIQIRFWADAVDRMPEEHVMTLIARELVHTYLWARGSQHLAMEENFVRDCLTLDWRFDDIALQEWISANAHNLASWRNASIDTGLA